MVHGKGKKPFVLSHKDEMILKAVHFYRYMTALDVAHLLYKPSSIRRVRDVLAALCGRGEDGVLVEIFKNRWKELSEDRSIVATAHIFEEVSLAGLMEIWNEFVVWRRDVCPTVPEEERLFSTSMNNRKVWVIEDGAAFTLMYPEDY